MCREIAGLHHTRLLVCRALEADRTARLPAFEIPNLAGFFKTSSDDARTRYRTGDRLDLVALLAELAADYTGAFVERDTLCAGRTTELRRREIGAEDGRRVGTLLLAGFEGTWDVVVCDIGRGGGRG